MPRRSLYRDRFFAHNGPGPYPCHFCGELVELEAVTVHHVDDDHGNDAVENLVAAHGPCHTGHHARHPERVARLAAANRQAGAALSAKRSATMRRVNAALTSEQRSAAARLRWARNRGEVA